MPVDFRNTNSLWASVAVETLVRLGLKTAILCPGSRSTPLTFAFATHDQIDALPILDERSAAFFALGCAKQQHRPVAIVCTSGTAGSNFYPAVIEAYESGVPLLIFTADRPPEMRDCASGQTIDQQKLYGRFAKYYSELAVPTVDIELLSYLRQTLVNGWRQSISPSPGPIHFNCPFRDPLPPIADGSTEGLKDIWNSERFFAAVGSLDMTMKEVRRRNSFCGESLPIAAWKQCQRGLIIAGSVSPKSPQDYCALVSELSRQLGWPVLAEGLSPLRNYQSLNDGQSLNDRLISTYDIILRQAKRSTDLIPTMVIQLGELPISKVLRQWLKVHQPLRWIVGSQKNLDPLHGPTQGTATSLEGLVDALKLAEKETAIPLKSDYAQQWLSYEQLIREPLDAQLLATPNLVESKVVWLLSQYLPENTPLFIANSMPVRDVEYFWPVGDRKIQPFFSRGANGIDGTLSTAMGVSHHNQPTVLLTGDLAFLHDTNGLLNAAKLTGHLTVVVINNNGGGIFEMLPIAEFAPTFEDYFVTPQQVDVAALCRAYGVAYQAIAAPSAFVESIRTLPSEGMRVLEVKCDRKQSVAQRKALLNIL
ncbi:MAG: 2-succinyl-5-enolpyruvyl-6-hydroxy-3-cyclohexene-1-carboxylic-acid synthase [Cyanobacteria bacterium J06621_11]